MCFVSLKCQMKCHVMLLYCFVASKVCFMIFLGAFSLGVDCMEPTGCL